MAKKLSILAFIIVFSILITTKVRAETYDLMQRVNETTISSHTIYYNATSGIAAGQIISAALPSFTFGGSYDFNDMALAEGNSTNCSTASFTGKTLAASPSGATWGAVLSGTTATFTSGTDTITAGRCVRITLNSNGAGHTITNPTVSSNTVYNITIQSSPTDSFQLAVIILNDTATPDADQIQVNSKVVDAIFFDVDVAANNCNNSTETSFAGNIIDFGILVPGVARYSNTTYPFICIDAAINSASGIKIFARSTRVNAVGGLVNGSDVIASATADLNNAGILSGYGLRVASTGTPQFGTFTMLAPFNNGVAGNVGQINGTLGTASAIVSSSVPVKTGTSSRIAVEVGVKAGNVTPKGVYTDVINFTAFTNL